MTQFVWQEKGYRTHSEELQDRLSWFKGKHTLKFGVNVLRAEYDQHSTNNNLFGNVRFTNRFTGQPYGDFLLGIPTTPLRGRFRPSSRTATAGRTTSSR